ncbi:MAG: PD40 domain-containing protein, partial [Sedimentisphaerales bacterium]|nr:PD40 domain-containing protein [Sedimentisphaerales bacterium]
RLWDAQSGKELRQLIGHGRGVNSAAFAPDGLRVVTVSSDATTRIWDAGTGKEQLPVKHEGGIWGVAFSPDGRQFATSGENNGIQFWDAKSGKQSQEPLTTFSPMRSLAFSPDGRLIATCAVSEASARIWDIKSGEEVRRLTQE